MLTNPRKLAARKSIQIYMIGSIMDFLDLVEPLSRL